MIALDHDLLAPIVRELSFTGVTTQVNGVKNVLVTTGRAAASERTLPGTLTFTITSGGLAIGSNINKQMLIESDKLPASHRDSKTASVRISNDPC